MFGVLKNPLDAWKWLGDWHADLSELPTTVRQVPSRLNLFFLILMSALLLCAGVVGSYFAATGTEPGDRVMLAFTIPFGLVGLGLVPLIPLSLRSGRRVAFDRDGVAVRGWWYRRLEDWSAPYSAFQGVAWRTEQVFTGRGTRFFHIVELRHREREKTIPLFVDAPIFGPMTDEELSSIAAGYAERLGLPVIGRAIGRGGH